MEVSTVREDDLRQAPVLGTSRVVRPTFRGEIQALRAVAVAVVVLYHLWPASARGGFVGVDIFFVISGFLITQQLVAEAMRTGRISLAEFWARRIRRILPAAVTVLLVCVAVVVLLMPQVTWQNNLANIRAAAGYYENWHLGINSVDYLAAENDPSLVQHYWSLSVEEQFYIVWPLLLLLVVLAAGRVKGARLRAWTVVAVSGVAAASFLVSVTWTAADPAMAFFATPTRAWEFAAGGLVAILVRGAPSSRTATARAVASWLGLGLVLCSVFAITKDDPFPGAVALLPVSGALLVIAAELTSPPAWSPAALTALKPVQWLGDNSYSIYLWHWPLITAGPWVLHHALSGSDRVVILAGTLVLAAVTKRFVEDPVRTGAVWRSRRWLTYGFAVVGVAALVTLSSSFSVDAQKSFQKAQTVERAQASQKTRALVGSHHRSCYGAAAMDPANRCRRPYARPKHLDTSFAAADGPNDPCLQKFDASVPALCTRGRKVAPTKTIAIVGNSHAWRLIPALTLYAEQHGWKVIVAARIDCLGLNTTAAGVHGPTANCLSWSAQVQRQLLSLRHLDAVIFPGYRYAETFTAGRNATSSEIHTAQQQVLATWSTFAAHGVRVIVTDDVPGMRPSPDPECIAQSNAGYDPCSVDRASVDGPNLLTVLADRNPKLASHVPLIQYFCDASRCHALIGGVIVYFDSHHLTTTYSRSLARYLGADIAAALQTKRPTPH